jgi:sodium-independent sulfate anion transporter 11
VITLGITIGAVVVPQGMAYAVLANLAPQFGLYSSFMGVLIYWFFATSKDITIGVSQPHLLTFSASLALQASRIAD